MAPLAAEPLRATTAPPRVEFAATPRAVRHRNVLLYPVPLDVISASIARKISSSFRNCSSVSGFEADNGAASYTGKTFGVGAEQSVHSPALPVFI
jgi:hypothetical protein